MYSSTDQSVLVQNSAEVSMYIQVPTEYSKLLRATGSHSFNSHSGGLELTGRGAFVSPPRTSASCSQPPAANETKTNNTNITVLINKGKLFARTQDILSQSKKSSRGKAGIIGNNTPT